MECGGRFGAAAVLADIYCFYSRTSIDTPTVSRYNYIVDEYNVDGLNEEELAALEDEEPAEEEDFAPAAEPLPKGSTVYSLFLSYSREVIFGICKDAGFPTGSQVIVNTRFGPDMAEVHGKITRSVNPKRIFKIERAASDNDFKKTALLREREKNAFSVCKEKIAFHGLGMKLLGAHYTIDEQKLIFFFTADGRVDFRALVKDLVGIFRTRIELRQVTSRDEARMGNVFGICGRHCCCSSISDKLNPTSIKMAKEQNLSLNTAKISGPCGRLLCCIYFEHNIYGEVRRSVPSEGSRISYEGGQWQVKEINTIAAAVTLIADDGRLQTIPACRFHRADNRWTISDCKQSADCTQSADLTSAESPKGGESD